MKTIKYVKDDEKNEDEEDYRVFDGEEDKTICNDCAFRAAACAEPYMESCLHYKQMEK